MRRLGVQFPSPAPETSSPRWACGLYVGFRYLIRPLRLVLFGLLERQVPDCLADVLVSQVLYRRVMVSVCGPSVLDREDIGLRSSPDDWRT